MGETNAPENIPTVGRHNSQPRESGLTPADFITSGNAFRFRILDEMRLSVMPLEIYGRLYLMTVKSS